MANQKIENFFKNVEKAGLLRAYNKIDEIASATLDSCLEDIIDDLLSLDERPQCRIRYCEKDDSGKECYIFEIRQSHDEEFGFSMSFALVNDMLSYKALTQIRELKRMGYEVFFG